MITGEGYSGHAATHFAVTHPERTLRLSLNNSYARLGRAEGFADLATMVEHEWGTGQITAQFAPALVSDPSFLDYFAARERRTASPSTAAGYARAIATSDIRELLPRVTVPTLVYYTGDLAHLPVGAQPLPGQPHPGCNPGRGSRAAPSISRQRPSA